MAIPPDLVKGCSSDGASASSHLHASVVSAFVGFYCKLLFQKLVTPVMLHSVGFVLVQLSLHRYIC